MSLHNHHCVHQGHTPKPATTAACANSRRRRWSTAWTSEGTLHYAICQAWRAFPALNFRVTTKGIPRTTACCAVRSTLAQEGVNTRIYYRHPTHQQPVYLRHFRALDLPNAQAHAHAQLALPVFAGMSEVEAEQVIQGGTLKKTSLHQGTSNIRRTPTAANCPRQWAPRPSPSGARPHWPSTWRCPPVRRTPAPIRPAHTASRRWRLSHGL